MIKKYRVVTEVSRATLADHNISIVGVLIVEFLGQSRLDHVGHIQLILDEYVRTTFRFRVLTYLSQAP